MLIPTSTRHLHWFASDAATGPRPLSAASGLLRLGERWLVVADDEAALGVFPTGSHSPGRGVPLLPTTLPADRPLAKAIKPDFECIARLPPFAGAPRGAVLVLGSGSRPNRMRGVVVPLGPGNRLRAAATIDLEPLYRSLGTHFDEVNVEGIVVRADEVLLFQRGHSGGQPNAVISLARERFLEDLAAGRLSAHGLRDVLPVSLGAIGSTPLTFTDACGLPDGRLVFTAAAEGTADAYADGPVAGSMVGLLAPDRSLLGLERFDAIEKLEGVAAWSSGERIELALVADADDPSRAAPMHRCTWLPGRG